MTVVAAARKRMPQMICGPHSPSVSAFERHPLHHSLTPCCRPHYSCTTQDLSKALLDTGDAQRQGACPVAVPMAVLHWHLDHSDSQPDNICASTTEHMVAGAALHQQHNHSDSQPDSICAALMVQSPHNTCTVVLVVADGVGGSALPTHTLLPPKQTSPHRIDAQPHSWLLDAQRQETCPVAVPVAALHWHLDHSESQPDSICATLMQSPHNIWTPMLPPSNSRRCMLQNPPWWPPHRCHPRPVVVVASPLYHLARQLAA